MAQRSATPQAAQQLFDLLKKDHRQAEKMMKQIESASPEEREDLFSSLKEALSEHMSMEEKEFYPKLKKIKEMEDLLQDALTEHKEAKEYLAELEDMDIEKKEWFNTFQDLQEGIQHHVQDEEKEIFPECKRHLTEQQFTEIAEKCARIKEKAPSASARKVSSQHKQIKKQSTV